MSRVLADWVRSMQKRRDVKPLDPNSPRGRDVARRLTIVLTEIEMELEAADAAASGEGPKPAAEPHNYET